MTDAKNFFSWRHAILGSNLKATTRHVLLTLACHMNSMGEGAFPSTKLLAKETGLSERAVVTHLAIARDQEWIVVRVHGFKGRGWLRHEYCLCWPDSAEPRSAASFNKALNDVQRQPAEALKEVPRGAERDDIKALNHVQSSTSVNSPRNSSGHNLAGRLAVDKKPPGTKKPEPAVEFLAAVDFALSERFGPIPPHAAKLLIEKCTEQAGPAALELVVPEICEYIRHLDVPPKIRNPIGWIMSEVPKSFTPKTREARGLTKGKP